ncbi:MAG: hypothetical protein ACK54P_02830 [Bacteroidota bacterium]
MAELTDHQTEQVSSAIQASIHDRRLQLELIDHCCCHIEQMLGGGIPFDEALKRRGIIPPPSAARPPEDDGGFDSEAD